MAAGDAGADARPPIAPRPAGTNLGIYVGPAGSDANDGLSPERPIRSLNQAFRWAEPGDTIHLLPGEHVVATDLGSGGDLVSWRHGRPDAPITIKGPPEAIVKSRPASGRDRIFYIVHNHIVLEGFTIDGLRGPNAADCKAYVDTLVYVQGGMFKHPTLGYVEPRYPKQPVTGVKLVRLTLRNAGGECVRLRYFAQKNEVAFSRISRCGAKDFLPGSTCKTGVNGEGVYVGTSSLQWTDGKNASGDPDQANENWIHDNEIDTRANECVEVKEGGTKNLVEKNRCTGQLDGNSGGFGSRGTGNVFRGNEAFGNKGAGIRLGGHDGYGTGNDVYDNVFRDNDRGAFNVQVSPQGKVCGNRISGSLGRAPRGVDPAAPCP